MKKVALIIASLGMVSGVAVAHHGASHPLAHHGGVHQNQVATPGQSKAESGFRFAVGKSDTMKKPHTHNGDVGCHTDTANGYHCHN